VFALALAAAPAAATDDPWTTAETDTGEDLGGVTGSAHGLYAVGTGGVVLERGDAGWTTVLQGGPAGDGNDLLAVDATGDGEHVWYAGSSGALGVHDPSTGEFFDRSGPDDTGDNFQAVAAAGSAGDANVYAATGSGHVFYSLDDGAEGSWEYASPTSGTAIVALDMHGETAGHLVDADGSVYQTTDGQSWSRIGIADADVDLRGLDSDGLDDVWVVGNAGTVYHYDGTEWTTATAGTPDLVDVEVASTGEAMAAAADGSVYHRADGSWHADSTETERALHGVALGSPNAAVGAGGTALELVHDTGGSTSDGTDDSTGDSTSDGNTTDDGSTSEGTDGGSGDGTSTGDAGPSVTIATPGGGATVARGHEVPLAGSARAGDATLASLTVRVDGDAQAVHGIEDWTATWTPEATGTVTVEATVTDQEGREATDRVTLDVEAVEPPELQVDVREEVEVGETLDVEGEATPGDAALEAVEVTVAGQTLDAQAPSSWQATWTPEEDDVGERTVEVTVTDANGVQATETRTVTVASAEAAPTPSTTVAAVVGALAVVALAVLAWRTR